MTLPQEFRSRLSSLDHRYPALARGGMSRTQLGTSPSAWPSGSDISWRSYRPRDPGLLGDSLLYGDSLRAELIKFVPTKEGELLGKAHWDIPGTAMGAWFLEGAPAGNLLGPESTHYTLFLGRFALRQSVRLVAVGGWWPGMHNSTFALDPAVLDWEKVTPATGRIAQKAWYSSLMGEFNNDWPGGGTFLIEMLAEDRLRLEWFDTHEPVTEFTAAARVYVR